MEADEAAQPDLAPTLPFSPPVSLRHANADVAASTALRSVCIALLAHAGFDGARAPLCSIGRYAQAMHSCLRRCCQCPSCSCESPPRQSRQIGSCALRQSGRSCTSRGVLTYSDIVTRVRRSLTQTLAVAVLEDNGVAHPAELERYVDRGIIGYGNQLQEVLQRLRNVDSLAPGSSYELVDPLAADQYVYCAPLRSGCVTKAAQTRCAAFPTASRSCAVRRDRHRIADRSASARLQGSVGD